MSEGKEISHIEGVRHSLSHLLAAAVLDLFPGTKNTTGPAIENGFYEDFDVPTTITEGDLPKIEARMREILKTWGDFQRSEVTPEEARKEFAWNPYKLELIDDFSKEGKQLTFYTSGAFVDLCRGGHVQNAREINPKAFKITKVSGAYWRGDQSRQQLQRVYGVAFETPEELRDYLTMMEEAKRRDHRKLGQELDLFVFSELVGPGLPLFTPRGTVLRDELGRFSQELQAAAGYQRVAIPHMARTALYKTSGHYDKYPERFTVTSFESDDEFMMKPMNCPHHAQIYASRPRSYRDLPIRYMENTVVYRDEKAGELHGLSRVRAATQDDAHVFARLDQIEEEFTSIMTMIRDMYAVFGLKWRARLSFRDDSDKYLGDPKVWADAQATIERVAKKLELDYFIGEGEAAFYGPKIDIMATDALGREWQLATEQLDFIQPERFGLEYAAEDGTQQRPVMIHKALLGSIERFLAVYIEHTAGRFPVWLAPEQVRLITVNQEDATVAFAQKVLERAQELGVRAVIDNSNESVGKKIRASELMKVPYTVVLGEKEMADGEVSPRVRKDLEVTAEHPAMAIDDFLKTVGHEAKSRVNKSSL